MIIKRKQKKKKRGERKFELINANQIKPRYGNCNSH